MKKLRMEIYDRIMKGVVLAESVYKFNPNDATTYCYVWTGPTSGTKEQTRGGGYGRVSYGGCTMAVHRIIYTHFYGIIPHNKTIDHLCGNRLCCNPHHLECVTNKKNNRRKYKSKTSKHNGNPNTY